jgi:hypothetical protein
MRFSIRDLLWGTLVVAMGLGWRVDHRRMESVFLEQQAQLRRRHEAEIARIRAETVPIANIKVRTRPILPPITRATPSTAGSAEAEVPGIRSLSR